MIKKKLIPLWLIISILSLSVSILKAQVMAAEMEQEGRMVSG